MLFPDGEYQGVLIFTTRMDGIQWEGEELRVLSGTPLAAIAIRASMLSLGSAEFAAGIPGTVGGAVLMNAGAYGSSMEKIVTCPAEECNQGLHCQRQVRDFGPERLYSLSERCCNLR